MFHFDFLSFNLFSNLCSYFNKNEIEIKKEAKNFILPLFGSESSIYSLE